MNRSMKKLIFYVPESHKETVKEALFEIGAGKIGEYDKCSFEILGTGQYRPLEKSNPFHGKHGELEVVNEWKVEVVFFSEIQDQVREVLLKKHPYETVAYQFISFEN